MAMGDAGKLDFFISYTRSDRAWAEWIAWQLEHTGYNTTIQAWDFRPGHNLVVAMHEAAIRADRTIAVLSPAFFQSQFVSPEWAAAFAEDPTGRESKLVPVRVRAGKPPGLLGQIVYIDLVDKVEAIARDILLEGVRTGRARPECPPLFPAPGTSTHGDVPAFPGQASSRTTPGQILRAGQVVVGELPSAPPAFVMREAVDRLAAAFAADSSIAVSVLTGGRGTGKTQIAAQYAREAVANGIELVAWVSAVDQNRLLAGLADVANRLGVADPKGDSEASAGRLRDMLAARTAPAVLVFDNACDPQVLRHYLPTTGATQVVITSTDRAFSSLGSEIAVDVFDEPQAIAYLSKRTGVVDESGANAVATALGFLPLALAQAATVIALQDLTYEVYLARLASLPLEEMLPPDRGDSYPHSLARAVSMSVEAVQKTDPTGLTSRVLASVAVLDVAGVSRDILEEIVNATAGAKHQLDATLAHLVEYSLVVWTEDHRALAMHRLVSRAIQDRLQTSGDLHACMTDTADGLTRVLPAEAHAWEHRQSGVEIVGQAVGLWESAVSAAARDAITQAELHEYAHLAHWAVRHLLATADLSRAIEIGTSVLAACAAFLGADHPDTLTSRGNLAKAYELSGDLNRGIRLYEEALVARERVLGADHPDTLASCNNLASAYRSAGNLDRAIPLLEEALVARERVLGADHPDTLASRNNLASAYRSAGDLDRAIPMLEETLIACERALGTDHPSTFAPRNNLAGAYESAGDPDRAIPLLEDTLTASERVLGPDHPSTLASRNNLAGAYGAARYLGKAISLLEDNLAARERVLGPEHPDTLISRNNLAGAYESSGDLGRAILLFEDTLSACELVLGADHPNTCAARDNLINAYGASGDFGRAIPLFEDVLGVQERMLGRDHPDTCAARDDLINAYESSGDFGRAIPLFEDVLGVRERMLGRDHPDTCAARDDLINAYESSGDFGRAIPLFEDVLGVRERMLGRDHPDTCAARDNLIDAFQFIGQLHLAIPFLIDTVAARELALGPDHSYTLRSRNNLASAYRSAGDLDRAIALHEDTGCTYERILGPHHLSTLTSRNNLANAYYSAGDLGRAISLHEDTLSRCELALNPEHPLTKTVLANLNVVLERRLSSRNRD